MKLKVLCLLSALLLLPQAAIAQEYPGNFWINPSTGELEEIELDSTSSGSNPLRISRFVTQWVQVTTTLEGDLVEVDTIATLNR